MKSLCRGREGQPPQWHFTFPCLQIYCSVIYLSVSVFLSPSCESIWLKLLVLVSFVSPCILNFLVWLCRKWYWTEQWVTLKAAEILMHSECHTVLTGLRCARSLSVWIQLKCVVCSIPLCVWGQHKLKTRMMGFLGSEVIFPTPWRRSVAPLCKQRILQQSGWTAMRRPGWRPPGLTY